MTDVVIRLAEPEDLMAIKAIADEFRNELGFVYAAELVRGISSGSVIVAEVGGQIVGFIYFRCRKDRIAIIYAVAVTIGWQRRGIGSKLVSACKEVAKERGCVMMRLKCPIRSLGTNLFYKKLGFKLVGIVDGKKQKLMEWKKVI